MRKHFAYYNEFDPKAAAWLRELIKLGEIMDGEVDERSIADVRPDDLVGFARCHFFAGIGGWDLALRHAGWREDVHVWSGSCPCQAFSCAGQQKGFADERDLWPVFFKLIRECRPDVVLGEQVENAVRHGWLDRLYADMEGEDYACGSVVLGAHSAGADHIRQRIYWVGRLADAELLERQGRVCERRIESRETWKAQPELAGLGETGRLEDSARVGRGGRDDGDTSGVRRALQAAGSGGAGGVVFPGEQGLQGHAGNVGDGNEPGRLGTLAAGPVAETGGARNFWSDAIPHLCKDGKCRRFEPRIFPLAHGLPRGVGYSGDPRLPEYVNATAEARVMRLKGYGNAVNAETAAMFVKAVMDELDGKEVIA